MLQTDFFCAAVRAENLLAVSLEGEVARAVKSLSVVIVAKLAKALGVAPEKLLEAPMGSGGKK